MLEGLLRGLGPTVTVGGYKVGEGPLEGMGANG